MTECEFCGEEFDSDRELHIHWGEEHEDELNSHQEEKVKKAKREEEDEKKAKKSRRRNLMFKGLTAVSLLIFVGLVLPQVLSMFKSSPFQLEDQPMMGSENASVTVVEFGDYRCPYCQRFDQRVHPKLKENYIDTGKVKFYFINFPILGEGSNLAARASEYVYRNDPENFWAFHHALYDNQGSERRKWVTPELLGTIANRTTDINASELKEGLDNEKIKEAVQQDKRIAKSNGLRGTPTVYVNGEQVEASYQSIKSAIENKLKDGQ
ncbi:MAG: DsbA family protein [Candidatus Nanohalobium sp.]